ncbi:hypothetical protein [Mycolicibacterium sp.]|uniref:hypothetical protein n=1 Tax=Mycolicibacterium sp. TaxID=2320850 RepID=UPI003D149933
MSKVRTALTAALTALVIAAAAVLWHHLPTPTEVYAPFEVVGSQGEPVAGRVIALTVTDVRVGPRARARPRPVIAAAGQWVVVDADLEATSTFLMPEAELHVGENVYIPSDRFALAALGGPLAPGIPQRGSWVFDVAADLLTSNPGTTLQVWSGDDRFDSRLVVPVSLAGAERSDPIAVEPVAVGR